MKKIMKKMVFASALMVLPSCVFAKKMEALPEAENGVITLTENIELSNSFTLTEDTSIDLNGYKLSLLKGDNQIYANVEIKNGSLDISGAEAKANSIIGIGHYGNKAGELALTDVMFTGANYSSAYTVIYLYGSNKLNITNSTLDFDTELHSLGGVIKSENGVNGIVNIIDSTLDFTNTVRGFVDGTILIKNSEVKMTGTTPGGLDNGINTSSSGLALTIDNSKIDISGASGRGITLDNTTLTVLNNSVINISDCAEGDILAKTSGKIDADNTSTINAEISLREDATGTIEITGGNYSTDVSEFLSDSLKEEGYVCRETEESLCVISKDHNVVVSDTGNEFGTLKTNVEKAFAGDTVTITVEYTNDAYYLERIIVIDELGNEITVRNNTFEMPEGDVIIIAVFAEVETVVEVPTVDTTDEVKIGVTDSSEAKDVLLEELANSQIDVANKNVEVIVDIKNTDPEEETKGAFKEKVNNENIIISDYFETKLTIKDCLTLSELGTISKLSNKIELAILLSSELQEIENNYTRKYYIVSLSNGVLELIPQENKSLSFDFDEFGTYALAYEDIKNEDNGNNDNIEDGDNTGDNDNTGNGDNVEDGDNTEGDGNVEDNGDSDNTGSGNTNGDIPNSPSTSDNVITNVIVAIVSLITAFGCSLHLKRKQENQ